jgi:hypothetical protein
MSSTNSDDLVRLERALLVQMSAKKFYSGISSLDEQQAQHLRKIDTKIESLKEKRDEVFNSEGKSDSSGPAQDFLQDWMNDSKQQPEFPQKYMTPKRSYLDLEDPVKSSKKKRNVFLIVAVLLLVGVGAAMGIYFATKKGANDAGAASSSSKVNLLGNADFSKNSCPGSTTGCVSAVSDSISPWIVISDQKQYEIDPPGHFPFANESLAMDLNSSGDNGAYTIQQTITTVASSKYRLSFSLNGSPCRPSRKTGFVTASGNIRLEFSFNNDDETQALTYDFIASGTSTDISIGSTTPGSCGPVIFELQAVLTQ